MVNARKAKTGESLASSTTGANTGQTESVWFSRDFLAKGHVTK